MNGPPTIAYEDNAHGWISKVTVGGTVCTFTPTTEERLAFQVRIQPKAAQP